MNIIIWLIIGGVVGWLASIVMRRDAQQGILLNIIVGIVGAFIGGWLIGPLLGAGIVNGMKSWFTVAFPEYWLFFLGALFIVVTLYLPKGVIGLIKRRGEE